MFYADIAASYLGGCKGGGFLEPPLRFLFGTPFLFAKRNGVKKNVLLNLPERSRPFPTEWVRESRGKKRFYANFA